MAQHANDASSSTNAKVGNCSRTIGPMTVSWVTSTTEIGVKVTVRIRETMVAEMVLTPVAPQKDINITDGDIRVRGTIVALFDPSGDGKLHGDLQWEVGGVPSSYEGFIGSLEGCS